MPYNYLIDEKIRENFDVNFENSIMIFDEAHNTAPAAEEVSSFELKASYLEKCLVEIKDLEEAKSQTKDKEWKSDEEQLTMLMDITQAFLKFLTKFSLDPADNANCIQNVSNNRYLPP